MLVKYRRGVLKVYHNTKQYDTIMVSDGYSNFKWIVIMWGLNTNQILEEGYKKYIIILHSIIWIWEWYQIGILTPMPQ